MVLEKGHPMFTGPCFDQPPSVRTVTPLVLHLLKSPGQIKIFPVVIDSFKTNRGTKIEVVPPPQARAAGRLSVHNRAVLIPLQLADSQPQRLDGAH